KLEQLQAIYAHAKVKPTFVQNRCFASTRWDHAVRKFCGSSGIAYQGFSLLTANRTALSNPKVQDLARIKGRGIPEIIFRFAMQVGMIPLTGTTNPQNMTQDLTCYDFELTADEVGLIESLGA